MIDRPRPHTYQGTKRVTVGPFCDNCAGTLHGWDVVADAERCCIAGRQLAPRWRRCGRLADQVAREPQRVNRTIKRMALCVLILAARVIEIEERGDVLHGERHEVVSSPHG